MKFTKRYEDGGLQGNLWLWGEPWSDQPRIGVELHWWSNFRHALSASFHVGGEERYVGIVLACWRFFFALSLKDVFPQSFAHRSYEWSKRIEPQTKATTGTWAHDIDPFNHARVIGASVHDGCLWLWLWHNRMGWSSSDRSDWPWRTNGWQWTWRWFDALIGRSRVEDAETEVETIEVVMPEGRYPATVEHKRRRWCRRWWKGPWVWQSTISIPSGLPFPGKGENSWDCDDDGLFGSSLPVSREKPLARTLANEAAMSALRTRQQRGGLDWVPRDGWNPGGRPPPSVTAPPLETAPPAM